MPITVRQKYLFFILSDIVEQTYWVVIMPDNVEQKC